MCAQPSESLSEFAPEEGPATASVRPVGNDGVFVFDGEADSSAEVAVPGSLLDVVAAASPADTPAAPLSRIESRQARRRTSHLKRFARRAGALSSSVMASVVSAARAVSRRTREHTVDAARATRRASERTSSSVRSAAVATQQRVDTAIAGTSRLTQRMGATTLSAANAASDVWGQKWLSMRPQVGLRTQVRTVLEDLEFNGTIVVMSLAVVALAYGGFQRGARPAPVAPLTARVVEAVETAPVPVTEPAAAIAVPPAATTDVHVVTRPAKPPLSATTLNAIWKRQDSRSLQQAFTGLRNQTLAFHRCGMRVTDTDRAIATCEGASRARWTINFRRSAGRWQIDRVTTR